GGGGAGLTACAARARLTGAARPLPPPPLAQSDVVWNSALRIGVAGEVHGQVRVRLQLLDEAQQRGLGPIIELPAVEAEDHVHAFDVLTLVAIVPHTRQALIDAIGSRVGRIRSRVR